MRRLLRGLFRRYRCDGCGKVWWSFMGPPMPSIHDTLWYLPVWMLPPFGSVRRWCGPIGPAEA